MTAIESTFCRMRSLAFTAHCLSADPEVGGPLFWSFEAARSRATALSSTSAGGEMARFNERLR
jgi:hypothetical protein